MRWISAKAALPEPPRRAFLRSFWLVLSLCIGGLSAAILALVVSHVWACVGGILACALAVSGLLWPQICAKPYSAWNHLIRIYVRVTRRVLMSISFYIIFVAVGWSGSSLRLVRPAPTESLWVSRGTLAPSTYAHQYTGTTAASEQAGWTKTYLAWATRSGNFWAVALLPFVFLLAVLDVDQKDAGFPANIYTLF
jgi:hypothetical protein